MLLRGKPHGKLECGLVVIAALTEVPLWRVRRYAETLLKRQWPKNVEEFSNAIGLRSLRPAIERTFEHFVGYKESLTFPCVAPEIPLPTASQRGILVLNGDRWVHAIAVDRGEVIDSTTGVIDHYLLEDIPRKYAPPWLPIAFIPVPVCVRRSVGRGNGNRLRGIC